MKHYLACLALVATLPAASLAQEAKEAPATKETAKEAEIDFSKFQGYSKMTGGKEHIEINKDATYTRTVEYTLELLDKKGVDGLNTQSISYSNSLSDLKFIAAYTTKKNGKRINVPKNNYQVESNTGENGASPFISDIKTKTVVFPDVDVGDKITLKYDLIQKEALFPGHFTYAQTVSPYYINEGYEVSISAPESLAIRTEARGIEGGEKGKMNGKRHWSWKMVNKVIQKPEPAAVSLFDYGPRLIISTFKNYEELATAYELRARPKAAVTERIKKLAEEIAGKAKDERETAELLYDWVAKNIAYAGNCIGIGSVVPHDTDHILDNKLGDCKDHTALLQALLSARGIESHAALVNTDNTYSLPELPVVSQFDHVINYIPSLNIFADSTSQTTPFGMLPGAEEGKPVLLTSGYKDGMRTPPTDNKAHTGSMKADITINKDGSADVVMKSSMTGNNAIGAHEFFKRVEMTPYKNDIIKKSIRMTGLNGTGEYVRYDPPAGNKSPYTFELKYHVENAVSLPGPTGMYLRPFIGYHYVPVSTFLGTLNIDKPKQDFPCSGGSAVEEINLTVADGVEIVAVPKDAHITGKYGQYDATYKREGNKISIRKEMVDNTPGNVCKPEQYQDFHDFESQVAKDIKAQIILQ